MSISSVLISVLFFLLLSPAVGCSQGVKTLNGGKLSKLSTDNLGPYQSEGLERTALKSPSVIEAMSRVPRHLFVPASESDEAYEDRALSIGSGQTISQPFIVALMSQEAQIGVGAKVLEVGTGSGYQAAVLSELGAQVFSIEIIPELAARAREKLQELGYNNVTVFEGDGWKGLPDQAPFDAILVTAAAPKPPITLISQLANRGRLVIPIEREDRDGEDLMVFEKDGDNFITRNLGAVKFVPLTGEARTEESRLENAHQKEGRS